MPKYAQLEPLLLPHAPPTPTPHPGSAAHSLGTVRLKRRQLSMIFSMLRIWSRV